MTDEIKWYYPLIPAIFLAGVIGTNTDGDFIQLIVNVVISYAICYGILDYIVNKDKKEEDSE